MWPEIMKILFSKIDAEVMKSINWKNIENLKINFNKFWSNLF